MSTDFNRASNPLLDHAKEGCNPFVIVEYSREIVRMDSGWEVLFINDSVGVTDNVWR